MRRFRQVMIEERGLKTWIKIAVLNSGICTGSSCKKRQKERRERKK